VVAIDAKTVAPGKWEIFTHGGRRATGIDAVEFAQTVVAKGAGYVAERIRTLAAEHGVPIVEQKPLARSLFKGVDIGAYIPADLYQAVAEILAYVYRLREMKGRTSR